VLRLRAPRTEATRPCGEYPSSPSVQTQSVSVCAMAYSIELRPAARTKRVSAPRVPRDAPPARIYLFYYLSRETHLRSERDSERVDQHMHNQHYNTTTTEVRTRPVTSWPVHSVHDCTSDVHTPSVAWDLRRPLVESLLTHTRQHGGVQYYRGLAGSLGARLPGARRRGTRSIPIHHHRSQGSLVACDELARVRLDSGLSSPSRGRDAARR
jgi:hypothetical protein